MPLYDWSCSNHKKPYEFECAVALSDEKSARCPRCHTRNKVKKIIKKAFPVSRSWRVSG